MLKNLYEFRRYILQITWEEVRNQYSGTGFGPFWNVLNPLLEITIYSLVFSQLVALRSGGSRGFGYVVFLCAGLFPWNAFSRTLSRGGNAYKQNSKYLSRLAIPLEIFVAKYAGVALIELVVFFLLYLPLLIFSSDHQLHWMQLLSIPAMILLQLMAFGFTLALANISLLIPDVKEAFAAILQLWRWLVPIMYPEEIFPENLRFILHINPFYYFLKTFRAVFIDVQLPPPHYWVIMLGWCLVALFLGHMVLQALYQDVQDNI